MRAGRTTSLLTASAVLTACASPPLGPPSVVSLEPSGGPDNRPTKITMEVSNLASSVVVDYSDPRASRVDRGVEAALARKGQTQARSILLESVRLDVGSPGTELEFAL